MSLSFSSNAKTGDGKIKMNGRRLKMKLAQKAFCDLKQVRFQFLLFPSSTLLKPPYLPYGSGLSHYCTLTRALSSSQCSGKPTGSRFLAALR